MIPSGMRRVDLVLRIWSVAVSTVSMRPESRIGCAQPAAEETWSSQAK
jgi:hypothetical protein